MIPTVDYKGMNDSDKVLAVIDLQDFEGWWDISDALVQITGLAREEFEKKKKMGMDGQTMKFWVTSLVLVFLETDAPAEKGVWELIVEKARGWVRMSGKDAAAAGMEAEAKRVLTARQGV